MDDHGAQPGCPSAAVRAATTRSFQIEIIRARYLEQKNCLEALPRRDRYCIDLWLEEDALSTRQIERGSGREA